jgi:hypothetical protein
MLLRVKIQNNIILLNANGCFTEDINELTGCKIMSTFIDKVFLPIRFRHVKPHTSQKIIDQTLFKIRYMENFSLHTVLSMTTFYKIKCYCHK